MPTIIEFANRFDRTDIQKALEGNALALVTDESGRSELVAFTCLSDAVRFKLEHDDGMSAVLSVEIFARLPD